jgi:NADH-quinone oxidoreductase subunit N
MNGWTLFGPELFVFGAALVFLMRSLVKAPSPRRDFIAALSLAALVVVADLAALKAQGTLFAEAYRVDLFSQVFKVLLAMGLFLVICLCSG